MILGPNAVPQVLDPLHPTVGRLKIQRGREFLYPEQEELLQLHVVWIAECQGFFVVSVGGFQGAERGKAGAYMRNSGSLPPTGA